MEVCGHDGNGPASCAPVTPGTLFIAIAPFTFFPFLILWAISCYRCYRHNEEDLEWLKFWRRGAGPVTGATPASTSYANAMVGSPFNATTGTPAAGAANAEAVVAVVVPPSRPARSASRNVELPAATRRTASTSPRPDSAGSAGGKSGSSGHGKQSPRAGRRPSSAGAEAASGWQCGQCTFSNRASAPACDMCGAVKPH